MFFRSSFFQNALILSIAIAGLLPWLAVQMPTSLNTNHAWLFVAAARIFDGGTLLQDVYEPNPPLSILLYFPAVLLNRFLAVPVEHAAYVAGFIYITFSSIALWHFIKPARFLKMYEKHLFILFYVIGCCIIPTNTFFAERDEVVVLGLIPFLVAQLMMMHGVRYTQKRSFVFLLISAIFILIKPHYIVIPCLLFLYEMWVKRSLTVLLKSLSVWAMGAACVIYAVIIAVFFGEYAAHIFEELLKYYVSSPNHLAIGIWLERLNIWFVVLIVAAFSPIRRDLKILSLLFVGAGFISLLLFLLQMKGFGYHLIPANMFIYGALTLTLYGYCERYIRKELLMPISAILATLLLAYNISPLRTKMLTHDEYKQLKLPQLVSSCGPPCPFFVFADNMEVIWQTSIYTGEIHASRFPSLWWLPGMLRTGYSEIDKARYAEMVAEDLERYDPKMLIMATSFEDDGHKFKLNEFFESEEKFTKQFSRYVYQSSFTDDKGSYFRGTRGEVNFPIEYDIYMRR